MKPRGVPGAVIRDAIATLLAKEAEPVPVWELVTAVYHVTDDDRVGYANVMLALRAMEAQGLVCRPSRGFWQAVSS